MKIPHDSAIYNVRIQDHLVSRLGSGLWFIRYYPQNGGHRTQRVKEIHLEWEDVEEGFHYGSPSIVVPHGILPALAEAMVEYRSLPGNFLHNDKELTAVKTHLTDIKQYSDRLMRIVEEKL